MKRRNYGVYCNNCLSSIWSRERFNSLKEADKTNCCDSPDYRYFIKGWPTKKEFHYVYLKEDKSE